ncbi:MAG: bifunctional 2-polyprenyl-6-hydroxyphenol methylase/3-demethylubiquinol 3-O-methyltransferase UbiG, partial [Caulobacteraceae bacterium]
LVSGGAPFDVVLALEVIEHAAEPRRFILDCAKALAPGGLMIVATLNRTLKALALAKIGAEYVLRWAPVGTHDWRKFVTPREMRGFVSGEALEVEGPFGVSFEPLSLRWSLSTDASVNYLMTIARPAESGG